MNNQAPVCVCASGYNNINDKKNCVPNGKTQFQLNKLEVVGRIHKLLLYKIYFISYFGKSENKNVGYVDESENKYTFFLMPHGTHLSSCLV